MYAPAIPTNVDLNRPVRSKFQLPPPALGSISSKNDTRKDRTPTTTRYLRKKDGSKDVYETTEDKPAPTATASAPAAFYAGPGKLGPVSNVLEAPTSIKGTQLKEDYFKKGGKTKKRRRKKRKKRKTKKKRRRKKKTKKRRAPKKKN